MDSERAVAVLGEFLSVEQAAARLGKSVKAVELAIRQGRLRAVDPPGRRLIHPDWLEGYGGPIRSGKESGEIAVADSRSGEGLAVADSSPVAPPIYKEEARPPAPPVQPILGRLGQNAMANERVKPRPKEAWLKGKKGEQRQGSYEGELTV